MELIAGWLSCGSFSKIYSESGIVENESTKPNYPDLRQILLTTDA
jgi:hypothetical protein